MTSFLMLTAAEHSAVVDKLNVRIKDLEQALAIKGATNSKIFALNEELIAERFELLATIEWYRNRGAHADAIR